ncbi:MAG: ABC transporter permease [Chloroflexota bacterium]
MTAHEEKVSAVHLGEAPAVGLDLSSQSKPTSTLRRLRGYPLAVFGAITLIVLALIAISAEAIAPYDPLSTSLDVLAPPSSAHLLGTDDVGRDVLSRLIFAARVSLTVGFVSMLITIVIGLALGVIAGFYGPWVDLPVSSFINIMLSIPIFPLALVIGSFLDMTLGIIVLVIGFLSWMGVARVVRAEVLSLREREFVEAARCAGASPARIIVKHILPNIANPVIVAATLLVANGILLEAALSYLGYGIQPPTPSWGNMLMDAQRYLRAYPGLAIYPGVLISLTVVSINFLGDGLRDALDPQMRGR